MAQNTRGPSEDIRPLELRSIAKSIEPLFPDQAETLRAIADTLTPARALTTEAGL